MQNKKQQKKQTSNSQSNQFDVIIVGAGAAGIGCALTLRNFRVENFVLLERDKVGASFANWPAEMRFITPSFPSNAFGLLDINAVAPQTSPAYSLAREHPSGTDFAAHLKGLVEHFELPVESGVEVHSLSETAEGFDVCTSQGVLRARFVVWAAGEFAYPKTGGFEGAELCLHNSRVHSWRDLKGDKFLIIGGYESGIDAASHLVALGKRVRVLDAATIGKSDDSDPSLGLSPFTQERLDNALQTNRLELIGARVLHVRQTARGYVVESEDGERFLSPTQPILASGFEGSLSLVSDLLEWSEEGHAQLSSHDESTRTPNLFVCGPNIRHDKVIFCFIYKYRQRFAIVADAIANRLGLETEQARDFYRKNNLYLDDLSCCAEACEC